VSLARGLFVQLQVAQALIIRETRTRFGANQLGFLWALLEPVLFVGTFYVLFALSERSPPSGMTLGAFMVTGLIPYSIFRETSSRVAVAVSSNRGLLFYPQVKPLDLVIARVVLEMMTWTLVFVVLVGAEAMVIGDLQIDSLLPVYWGFALCSLLGGALGMLLGTLSLYMSSMERLSGALLRPMFWLSGIFYTANDVPMSILGIIKFNPVLHCVEMVRDGWFPAYDSRHLEAYYPLSVGLLLLLLALIMERTSRAKVQLT